MANKPNRKGKPLQIYLSEDQRTALEGMGATVTAAIKAAIDGAIAAHKRGEQGGASAAVPTPPQPPARPVSAETASVRVSAPTRTLEEPHVAATAVAAVRHVSTPRTAVPAPKTVAVDGFDGVPVLARRPFARPARKPKA